MTRMTNYSGMPTEDVASIIVKTASEDLGKNSGDDINLQDYYPEWVNKIYG